MKKTSVILAAALLAAIGISNVSIAADASAATATAAGNTATAPDELVRSVINDVLAAIAKDKAIQNGSTKRAAELVNEKVVPYINVQAMTKAAVGGAREWNKATPAQQTALSGEFRTLLVRTYSNALTSYKNQTVDYKPFKMADADKIAVVNTVITQPGSKPIKITYELEKFGNGWKVTDLIIADVRMVTSYKDQFKADWTAGGADQLLKTLRAKNAANPKQ